MSAGLFITDIFASLPTDNSRYVCRRYSDCRNSHSSLGCLRDNEKGKRHQAHKHMKISHWLNTFQKQQVYKTPVDRKWKYFITALLPGSESVDLQTVCNRVGGRTGVTGDGIVITDTGLLTL